MYYYSVTHRTRYRYSAPVSEAINEVRMQPRNDANQRCLRFRLQTSPQARIHEYVEASGNVVHYFDIPARHMQLSILAEAIVQTQPPPKLPDALPMEAWDELDALARSSDAYDMLLPGDLTNPSEQLTAFMERIGASRRLDPLTMVRHIKRSIFDSFDYVPESTEVDSHIDHTLMTGKGVCQDFSHIMLATCRALGIPARYVSGYLFHRKNNGGRSTPDASHAWVEVLLPGLGWFGLDPTNNLLGEGRHIRVAIGREYSDVPPSRGVFKGVAESKLHVEVKVAQLEHPPVIDDAPPAGNGAFSGEPADPLSQMQQQQQQ